MYLANIFQNEFPNLSYDFFRMIAFKLIISRLPGNYDFKTI